jgi:hypothetical protein
MDLLIMNREGKEINVSGYFSLVFALESVILMNMYGVSSGWALISFATVTDLIPFSFGHIGKHLLNVGLWDPIFNFQVLLPVAKVLLEQNESISKTHALYIHQC